MLNLIDGEGVKLKEEEYGGESERRVRNVRV
jgi:hypothetical protein